MSGLSAAIGERDAWMTDGGNRPQGRVEGDVKSLYLAPAALLAAFSLPAAAQTGHQDHDMPMPGMAMPAPPPAQQPPPAPMPGMEMPAQTPPPPAPAEPDASMAGMDMGDMNFDPAAMRMTQESGSGTAWQPRASPHAGAHIKAGSWFVMVHGVLNGVHDWQGGPRGGEKDFASGMLMATASRRLSTASGIELKAMLSPDPLMGRRGYPLLLAAGETANGRDPLVDRQHPHDFFMELSARYTLQLGSDASLFLYG